VVDRQSNQSPHATYVAGRSERVERRSGGGVVRAFPKLKVSSWDYAANLTVPGRVALDRGVVVLHGMRVGGKYDELMPIACGAIDPAVTRKVALDPMNESSVAGTARLSLAGSHLYVWLSLGGGITGRTHMQHIHRFLLGLALDRGVIVVHGMDVHGHYDDTIPVACGAITPALPQARSVQSGFGPSTSAYKGQPRTGRGGHPTSDY
jgi:hypothetical protein